MKSPLNALLNTSKISWDSFCPAGAELSAVAAGFDAGLRGFGFGKFGAREPRRRSEGVGFLEGIVPYLLSVCCADR